MEKNPHIERLRKRYEEVVAKLSFIRKQGAYTKIAEILIMNIQSKIRYAEVNQKQADYDRVDSLLDQVETEIEEARAEANIQFEKQRINFNGLEQEKDKK